MLGGALLVSVNMRSGTVAGEGQKSLEREI